MSSYRRIDKVTRGKEVWERDGLSRRKNKLQCLQLSFSNLVSAGSAGWGLCEIKEHAEN